MAAGLALILAVAVGNIVVGRPTLLVPLLVVGPLVAAVRAGPLAVAGVAAAAVAACVALTFIDDMWEDGSAEATLVAVAGCGLLAVAVARSQHALAGTAHRTGVELVAERRAHRRTVLLARFGELLEAGAELDVILDRATSLPIPDFADLAVADLLDEEGGLTRTVVAATDPQLAARLRTLRRQQPVGLHSANPIADALRDGQPRLLERISQEVLDAAATSEEHRELMRAARYRSALLLPLVARGRTFGVLSLIRTGSSPPYEAADVSLGLDLARRAALALDNARLFRELQASERRLEAIITNLGEAVVAVEPDGSALFINEATARMIGAPSAEAVMSGEIGDLWEILSRYRLFDEHGVEVPIPAHPILEALRGGTPEPMLMRSVERETGSERWILARAEPVRDAAGELQLVVSIIEDVTAVKRQEERERLLSTASKLLGSSLDIDITLEKAAWAAVPTLADWAMIDLLDERGDLAASAYAHRHEALIDHLRRWREEHHPDPARDGGPWEVIRTGRTIACDGGNDDPEGYGEMPEPLRPRSVMTVPLDAGGRVIGTLRLATTSASDRRLGEGAREIAEELGRRIAIAVVNAQIHTERTHIATTLQQSLLPPRLPELPGLAIAARFRAAGTIADPDGARRVTEVGGDFYDVFDGRDAAIAVIGDVTGKGAGAAAATSLARNTLRAVALYESDPRAMLRRLNDTLSVDSDRQRVCTAVLVEVGAPNGDAVPLRVTRAGHPPPLLLRADGTVEEIGEAGTLLGALPEGRWSPHDLELKRGERLLLYTDGVTDVEGPEGRFGSERLAAMLSDEGPGAACERIAERIMVAVGEFGRQRDDMALLVLGR